MSDELSADDVAEFNEHATPSGTVGLAKYRQPLPDAPSAAERFVIERDSDGHYTAQKPGVYGIQVGNGLGVEAMGDGFVPLYEVKEQLGKPLPNRRERREWARQAARQLNRSRRRRVVAIQPAEDEPC